MVCRFCDSKYAYADVTNLASKDMASVSITHNRRGRGKHENEMVLIGSEHTYYNIPIKFCPMCGRDLSAQYVRNTEQDYSNILRKRIKEELETEEVSLNRLAKDTGIAKSTLSDFLNGKVKNLSAGKIGLIADSLSIPIDRLFAPFEVNLTAMEGVKKDYLI